MPEFDCQKAGRVLSTLAGAVLPVQQSTRLSFAGWSGVQAGHLCLPQLRACREGVTDLRSSLSALVVCNMDMRGVLACRVEGCRHQNSTPGAQVHWCDVMQMHGWCA